MSNAFDYEKLIEDLIFMARENHHNKFKGNLKLLQI